MKLQALSLSLSLTLAAAGKLRQQSDHPLNRHLRYNDKALNLFEDGLGSSEEKFQGSLPSYMHRTDEIHEQIKKLQEDCIGANLTLKTETKKSLITDRTVHIDVVTIRGMHEKASPKNKVFFLFGEHARELISVESALHFMKQLCSGSERAKTTLMQSEFMIIPNGNPDSRKRVEAGDFCVRVNPGGVDLNRNWDSHWHAGITHSAQTYGGNKPFSELETQVFKEQVQEYNPTSFISIHSGTLGMYMPWAYDRQHLANRNQPEMMQILQEVDQKHCECPFGAAGKEVGYSCPGTCIDWVYSNLDTKYAFAFEIYFGGDKEQLKSRWREKVAELKAKNKASLLSGNHSNLAHDDIKDFFKQYPSTFVQLKSQEQLHHQEGKNLLGEHGESSFECFGLFNPATASKYQETVENWSEAYFDTADKIAAKL